MLSEYHGQVRNKVYLRYFCCLEEDLGIYSRYDETGKGSLFENAAMTTVTQYCKIELLIVQIVREEIASNRKYENPY